MPRPHKNNSLTVVRCWPGSRPALQWRANNHIQMEPVAGQVPTKDNLFPLCPPGTVSSIPGGHSGKRVALSLALQPPAPFACGRSHSIFVRGRSSYLVSALPVHKWTIGKCHVPTLPGVCYSLARLWTANTIPRCLVVSTPALSGDQHTSAFVESKYVTDTL